jgi:hypothetical protein
LNQERARQQEAKRKAIAEREAQMVEDARRAAELKDQIAAKKAAEAELIRQ